MYQNQTVTCLPYSSEVLYTSQTESELWGRIKSIFSHTIFLPYTCMHKLIGGYLACPRSRALLKKKMEIIHHQDLKPERKTIMADGYPVDVIIMRRTDEMAPRKWSIVAGGNGEGIYSLQRYENLTTQLGGNALYFDYRGLSNRSALLKAACVMMQFVEAQGAKEITCIGASLGGGVLREAYKYHRGGDKKADANYAFLFDRTFSRLPYAASAMIENALSQCQYRIVAKINGYIIGFLSWVFGWNLGSLSISKHIGFEIAIQDKDDDVIYESAWLRGREHSQAYIVSGYGHMGEVRDCYPELAQRVQTHFSTLA